MGHGSWVARVTRVSSLAGQMSRRSHCPLCVINGRLSSVELSRQHLRQPTCRAWPKGRKIAKFKVLDKVPEGSTLIFEHTTGICSVLGTTSCRYAISARSHKKHWYRLCVITSLMRPAVSRLVTDRQTDTRPWHIPR